MKLKLYRLKILKCWETEHMWFKYVGNSQQPGHGTFPFKGGWCGRCGHEATFLEAVQAGLHC